MTVPIGPSPMATHQFHHQIDQFVSDIFRAVEEAKSQGGKAKDTDIIRLANDIERLEKNANQVIREADADEETLIDAQIILGVITQSIHPGDRDVTMLHAARDFKKKSNDDLKEIIRAFSENDEEKERLIMAINQISHEIILRCDIKNPSSSSTSERKNA